MSFTNFVRKGFLAECFCYTTEGHFKNAQLKSMMYSCCRSLTGNQIDELPAGVFSNNNKLLNLWVGRLKVHSRPIYFYCKILLQILINSKILKYYRTRLMSPATIVLREEPYLLVHFLEYHNIYLLATDEGSTALIGTFSKPRLRWQRRRGKKKIKWAEQ